MPTNKQRKVSGQTLPFMVIAILVIFAVGIAITVFSQMIAGAHEHKNATDAGVLNLNKRAVADAKVPFDSTSSFQQMYKQCSDPNSKGVDLQSYNGMVSSALLIALNASADGRASGLANAKKIITDLQGSEQSVGAKLKNLMVAPDDANNWARHDFEQIALTNSLRMLGNDKDGKMDWDKSQYKTAYLESDSQDLGATSIPAAKLAENMPLSYDANGIKEARMAVPENMIVNDGLDKYLHGYEAIKIPNLETPIYAVPTQPKRQPHLVSLSTFHERKYQEQPGLDKGVYLPPNAFQAGAVTGSTVSTSAGIVGMPADPAAMEIRLPQGYLIIDNSLQTNYKAALPSNDTWVANEAGTGTLVHRTSGVFSSSSFLNGKPYNALESWLQTPRSEPFNAELGPAIQDDDGVALLYDKDGKAITSKAEAARLIPYDLNTESVVIATDRNSDPDGNNPDSDAVAHNTPSFPDNLSPFDRAYHPNANANKGEGSGRNLIAAEQAKLHVLDMWGPSWQKGPRREFNRNFGRTGLRLYPNGVLPGLGGPYTYAPHGIVLTMEQNISSGTRVPYGDPAVNGKVTTDGSIEELFQQTTGNPKAVPYVRFDGTSSRLVKETESITPNQEVRRFILQRLREIKPNAGDAELAQVMNQKLPLGSTWYVYLATPSNPNSAFLVTQSPPSWASNHAPDGKRHAFASTYEISGNMIDAPNDFGIHDHLFMTNNVSATATDAVSYQASSGANGLLGIIKFFQFVKASGSLTME